MPNLIAGREVVKELIQGDFRPERVASEALALLESASRRDAVRSGLREVRVRLGAPGASARAAALVAQILKRGRKTLTAT
jgi:lipid-A-disaccharide synthase